MNFKKCLTLFAYWINFIKLSPLLQKTVVSIIEELGTTDKQKEENKDWFCFCHAEITIVGRHWFVSLQTISKYAYNSFF